MENIQVILFVIFMVFALIRAVRRNAQEGPDDPEKQARAADQRRKIRNNIEAFLEEVRGPTADKPPEDRPVQVPERSHSQVPAAPPSQAAPPRSRQRRPQKPRRQSMALERTEAARSIGERTLDSDIAEHVDTYISRHVAEHVDSKVDEFVKADIAKSVTSHLGDRSEELPPPTSPQTDGATRAAEFRKLLKSQNGVRQAVLLNEVLTKPRALRR